MRTWVVKSLMRVIPFLFFLAFFGSGTPAGAQTVTSDPIAQVYAGGRVGTIVRQSDGKVIVAGMFEYVNGVPRHGLARFNTDGSLDTTWNWTFYGSLNAIVLDSADNLYVGGSFYDSNIGGQPVSGLVRLTSSGAVDTTWNPSPANIYTRALAFDPVSGNLYVAGSFKTLGGQLSRISTTGGGVVDPTWNPNPNYAPTKLLVDNAGNIYASGAFTQIGGLQRNYMAKISAAGVVDPTWDPSPTPFPGHVYPINGLVLDPLTGNLYAAGNFTSIGGEAIGMLAKLSSSGTGAAITSWNPQYYHEVTALGVDTSGNVYFGDWQFNIARLSGTTAIADATWNPRGYWPSAPAIMEYPISAFAFDSAGNVFIGGGFTSIGGLRKTGFALLSKSGQGAANPAWPSVQTAGAIKAMVRDSVGRTVIAGNFSFMGDGVTVRNNIARLNSDNTLDTTWDPEANFEVDALALDASNNVYAGGSFTLIGSQGRNHLARLSASNGSADSWDPDPNNNITALALDNSSGNLFVGGNYSVIGVPAQTRAGLAKISVAGSGSADATWSPVVTRGYGNAITALTLDGSGSLYAGGTYIGIGGVSRAGLARLSTSGAGAVDVDWDPNPSQSGGNYYNRIGALTLDGGGNLYVGGNFTNIGGQARNHIARLSTTATGAADATWNPNANSDIGAISLDGNGHVYVGGSFSGYNSLVQTPQFGVGGAVRSGLARLFTSGTGTADCHWIANTNGPVTALALDTGGKVYVAGNFYEIDGIQRFGFAELTGSTAAGCKLGITDVNGGLDPSAGYPFSLTVRSQDSKGAVQAVTTDTVVTQSVKTGTGTLSGTTSCQINAGGYACTMPAEVYSKVESGVVLTAGRTSGDALDSGNSGPLNFIAARPPTHLSVIDVNGGAHPAAGAGFPITVQALDINGLPAYATVATTVGVWASGGTGVLTSGPTCQINVGANSCTMTGVTYSRAESGIIFTSSAGYGAGTLAGNSQPVTIDEPPGGRTLTLINVSNGVTTTPAGLNCASGYHCMGVFPTGSTVTINFTQDASVFGHWIGDCSGTTPSCTLTMDSDKAVSINTKATNTINYTTSAAYQPTTTVAGTTNPRVDQPQTRLLGRYNGGIVYDQTFDAPFADATVQAGVLAAKEAIRVAAHNAELQIGAPVLTGSTDTLLSTTTSYSDAVTESLAVNTATYIGPQTLPVGNLGNCALAPANCTGPTATFTLLAGQIDYDTLIVTNINTSRTIVNTATHLISSTYVVSDGVEGSDAALSALAVSSGALAPAFAPATLIYTDSVANSVASITVTPTLHDPTASLLVNGTPVASGSASPAIPLVVGSNAINIVVTAQDGATTRSYTITVNRTVTISIAFSGNGSGTVTSTSPDSRINCIKGSPDGCSAGFPLNTPVTLAAAANWKSLFIDWSNSLTGSANPVTFTMSANRPVTAKFDPNFKAKLMPNTLFASIQEAYASVPSGSMTIKAQVWSFLEELIFNNNTAVTLTGGMNSDYNPTSGHSTVKSLTVGKGSVEIGNITIM